MTITRRLPAFLVLSPPSARFSFSRFISLFKLDYFSEGHCLKVAHFFLKEAKLAY